MGDRERLLTVLVTGFGPFPGAPFNPTAALVRALARVRRAGDVRLVSHVFRTGYATVDRELPRLLEKHRPDVVLMSGLASKLTFIRVETQARNSRSTTLPDATGKGARTRALLPGGPHALRGRAPFVPIVAAVRRAGLPARPSHNAGRYLCNYLYWRVLERHGLERPRVAVFIHVPLVAQVKRPRRRGRKRQITANDLVRMGEIALRLLIAAARRR